MHQQLRLYVLMIRTTQIFYKYSKYSWCYWFHSPWIDIYKNHKICMTLIPTLLYSQEGCGFSLLVVFDFFFLLFFVNAPTTKTVRVDEWFESLKPFISILSIFLNLWIWMSRRMNQTYFEYYEFNIDVVLILIATCTYKSMLNGVRMNQINWISIWGWVGG